jgi:hypothetical protein
MNEDAVGPSVDDGWNSGVVVVSIETAYQGRYRNRRIGTRIPLGIHDEREWKGWATVELSVRGRVRDAGGAVQMRRGGLMENGRAGVVES